MNINASIIVDNILPHNIKDYRILEEYKYECTLKFAVLYDGDSIFKSDRVYVSKAELLPQRPSFEENTTIIAIGDPSPLYWQGKCNLICFYPTTRLPYAFNRVQEIFEKYNLWDQTLQRLLLNDSPIKEYGEVSLPIFGNPISFHDKNHKSVFLSYDPMNIELPADAIMEDDSYLPFEELNRMMSDPEYVSLYYEKTPVLLSDSMYNYSTLMQNVFQYDELLGKLCLYNIYRQFKTSDYIILPHLANYIKVAMESKNMNLAINPKRAEFLLSNLLDFGTYDENCFIESFSEIGWNINDSFACALFNTPSYAWSLNATKRTHTELDILLRKNSIILKENEMQFILINLTRCGFRRNDAKELIEDYFDKAGIVGGMSVCFNRIEQLPVYFNQAENAYYKSKNMPSGHCELFDSQIKEYLTDQLLLMNPVDSYIPNCLFELIKHDQEKGTEYYLLLKTFIENNMSIADTTRELFIHRSTFLYRLERIKEIMGTDLSDYDERLVIQISFMLLDRMQ